MSITVTKFMIYSNPVTHYVKKQRIMNKNTVNLMTQLQQRILSAMADILCTQRAHLCRREIRPVNYIQLSINLCYTLR